MFFGTVLVLAALSLFLWNQNENRQAGVAAEKILSQVAEKIEEAAEEQTSRPDPYSTEMTEVEIGGYRYIGYLTIPALDLELSVMSDWSYPQLKLSPCRYYGSAKTDDLVIAGHNYENYFGGIKNLSVGEPVMLTDMDGVTTRYEVAELTVLPPEAVEEMTDSGYALTLFTCTYGGESRVTVRCERSQEE